jgi:hypothetical protein
MGYLEDLIDNVRYGLRKRAIKSGSKNEAITILEKLEDIIDWE